MSWNEKNIDEYCKEKFGNNAEESENTTPIDSDLIHRFDDVWKIPPRLERKCLVGKDEIPCYFHGWFQLNTPTKDSNSIAYPVGIVEHRDDGVCEQVKVTSIKFVEEF